MGKRTNYAMVDETDPQWCRFWDAYPRRCAKKEARRAWLKLNPTDAVVDRMVDALAWQVPRYQWDGDKLDFAPYPATWLNAERWTDEPPAASKPQAMLSGSVNDPMVAWLQRKAVGQ